MLDTEKRTLKKRKRVAAYCRVSRDSERLMHSLSTQVSIYSALIQENPEWIYAGVYADEGISGTQADKRDEFGRMIADCEAGKIDIVLTKSISRFARNTVDLLNTVRHLKDIGVEVRFEREGINSLSADGELMLTILASYAQEESRSLSDNVKWSRLKGYEIGKPHARTPVFGYVREGDKLTTHPGQGLLKHAGFLHPAKYNIHGESALSEVVYHRFHHEKEKEEHGRACAVSC